MIAAVLPVKRFDAAKSRLAEALGPAERRLLAGAMFEDAVEAIDRSELIETVVVVSAEPRTAVVAERVGAELLGEPRKPGAAPSHSSAARAGVGHAIELGAEAAALLPADCPLLDPPELDRALASLSDRAAAVIPDRHGTGTNGLLLRPPDAIEPGFGPGSHARHLERARRADVPARTLPLQSLRADVDTGEDLGLIATELERQPAAIAPRTRRALRRIGVAPTSEPIGRADG